MQAVEVLRRYADAVGRQDLDGLRSIVSPDVLGHEPDRLVRGASELIENLRSWFDAFPDMYLTTEDTFGAGDRAAWRWRLRGTHAASGRRVDVGGTIVARVADDRVTEYWGHYDRLGMMRQQGLLD